MNPKLLGIPTQLFTKPLTQPLRTATRFQLVHESRPTIAKQLRDHELAAALLSPLDYARDSSDYRIVPNVAVVSHDGNGSIIVRFREGVKNISTVAVDPSFASEIILTKIILSEQFDIEPGILPMIASLDVMLQKADAALLVGDVAFRHREDSEDIIDIIEEWNEMTGLAYVHALWCGRGGDLAMEDIQRIQDAGTKGVAGISDIAMEFSKDVRDAVQQYLESFSYTMRDEAKEGLARFMKYLYCHGITPDVSELNFYSTEEANDNLLSGISSN
ncbi:MAG: MqnA/MqnD/SBP family protein [Bacteroidota bacterium]